MIIERSNLVNILKLVIKEVIDSSMKFGRQLDSDHIPLQHFFIVLEHALRHGLRPKKVIKWNKIIPGFKLIFCPFLACSSGPLGTKEGALGPPAARGEESYRGG